MNVLEIRDLPDEVWAEIFSPLQLDDRKSIRLCCRRFYEICNCDRILRGERIIFEGNFNFEPVLASLASSNRRTWNMELRRVHFTGERNFGEPFLRQQGAKMRSLTFDKCVKRGQSENMVASLITGCENLREIGFVFDASADADRFYRHFVDGLKLLDDLKVVRGTVETFTLKMPKGSLALCDFCLTDGDFLRIFDIFPNIRNLRLSLRVGWDFDMRLDAGLHPQSITFSCVYNQLLRMRQLVKLHLCFIDGERRLATSWWRRIGDIEANNLKELSLKCFCYWDKSVNPFPRWQHLTHFDCLLPLESTLYSTFVLQLLEAATELCTLKVRTRHEFSMSAECFRALVASRLATLSFYRYASDYFYETNEGLTTVHCADASFDPSITPNSTLRRLKMRGSQAWYLFSSYFTSLENFDGVDFQLETLLRLFESLPKLSDLTLSGCKGFEILQQEYYELSNCQLENLTRLKITEMTCVVSEFFLGKFIFPKLKSLEIGWIGFEREVSSNALLLAIGKLSQLESLDIRCNVESPFQQWLDLFTALPKLRSFVMAGYCSQVLHDEQYRYLFQVRPSLRMICIIRSNTHVVYYLKDMITNSVERRIRPRNQRYPPPVSIFL